MGLDDNSVEAFLKAVDAEKNRQIFFLEEGTAVGVAPARALRNVRHEWENDGRIKTWDSLEEKIEGFNGAHESNAGTDDGTFDEGWEAGMRRGHAQGFANGLEAAKKSAQESNAGTDIYQTGRDGVGMTNAATKPEAIALDVEAVKAELLDEIFELIRDYQLGRNVPGEPAAFYALRDVRDKYKKVLKP